MIRVILLLSLAWSGQASASGMCTLLSPSTGSTLLDFGMYTVLGGHVDRSANLTLNCVPNLLQSPTVSYVIRIDAGIGSNGSFTARQLTAGGYGLRYNLYRDPSRTLVWGDGTGGTAPVSGSCAATCAVTIYGRLFGGQGVPAAVYSDEVTISIDF